MEGAIALSFLIPHTSLLPKTFNSPPGICSAFAQLNALSVERPNLPLAFKPAISEAPHMGHSGLGGRGASLGSLPLPGGPHGGQTRMGQRGDVVAQEGKAGVGSRIFTKEILEQIPWRKLSCIASFLKGE